MNTTAINATPVLEIANLSGGYRAPLFSRVNLTLCPGEIVSVMGENGCGKTTLVDILMGLKKPMSGSVELFNQSASQLDCSAKSRIGWVISQEEDYPSHLSIEAFLNTIKVAYPSWNQELVASLAARFALDVSKRLAHLSLGESSKVKLIKALAHSPDLLIFDELTANLSESSGAAIVETLLDQFSSRSMAVLYFCHFREEALRISDRVFQLNKDGLSPITGGSQ